MINSISSATPVAAMTANITAVPFTNKLPKALNSAPGDTTLSTLSRQLSDSAVRAETRDNSMDRKQLWVEATRLMTQVFGDIYQANKAAHNKEVPLTTDPELLDRARKATEYIVRSDAHDRSVKNPFSDLSREQLNLIVYDEKGDYTVNERRAAYYGVSNIETVWNRSLWGPVNLESAMNDGRTPNFYREVLAHYRSLPPIEGARYTEEDEARLVSLIKKDSDPAPAKEKPFRLLTLFEIIAKLKQLEADNEKDQPSGPAVVSAVDTAPAPNAPAAC